ncbi:NAD(P)/FAD-dependent oxidoreductase [Nitrosomonas sp.]|uniref:NAD(P)/FAD-dependent oxidoreductase n=1 Tax=Nitrosomonas sp. TaxID=42353 RepID=UPI001D579768|nr:NAD(P)/FAD-dependent oxidoreductase [Nitrosomonas sp.]MBX3616187.1 NAD(P)/FAD-dependent oxidoreductase [Nitrosomonas sp.]
MRPQRFSKDVVIIGAGAAGMMCAIEAGKRGRRVLLVDHARKVGEKIRISGGGHCNFTNRYVKSENYISSNPNFCRSALARYTPQDFIALIKKHGIHFHEKKLGQLFCDGKSQHIINMLQNECLSAGVDWQMPSQVQKIEYSFANKENEFSNHKFSITTERNCIEAHSLVVATGGLSVPQIGASALGYKIAEQFGVPVIQLRPALVGLTFAGEDFAEFKNIPGITIDAEVNCNNASFRENILFTHRGLSGPAILQISSYWQPGQMLEVNLFPEQNLQQLFFENRKREVILPNLLARYLPKRFIKIWCSKLFSNMLVFSQPMSQYRGNELHYIAEKLHRWSIAPSGTVGYKKAEATAGGIDTRELSSKTMECKHVPGLHFIGEVVDVTGQLGGYNFQWAWSSGHAAGQFV